MNAVEHSLLHGLAVSGADAPAVVSARESLTYGALTARVSKFAAALRAAGVAPSDRVAVQMAARGHRRTPAHGHGQDSAPQASPRIELAGPRLIATWVCRLRLAGPTAQAGYHLLLGLARFDVPADIWHGTELALSRLLRCRPFGRQLCGELCLRLSRTQSP